MWDTFLVSTQTEFVKTNKYITQFGERVALCYVFTDMFLIFIFWQILKRVTINKGINDFIIYESNG